MNGPLGFTKCVIISRGLTASASIKYVLTGPSKAGICTG